MNNGYNGYFDSAFDSQTTAQKVPILLSVTGKDSFLATVDRVGFLPGSLYDWCKLQVAKDPMWRLEDPFTKLSVAEANNKYGIPGKLTFQSEIREEAAKLMFKSKEREISTEQTLGLRTSGQIIMSKPQAIAVTILDHFVLAGVIVLVSCRRRLSLWWHFLLYLIIGWILFKVFQIFPKW
jgi:hypothetical protein